ncbi:MAG: hypothetical protein V4751_02225 [Pseudomonadota bacterium]
MNANLKNKIKLTVLLLITALPVTMATLSFRSATDSGEVSATSNKGHLINPPADITALVVQDQNDDPVFRNFEETIASLPEDQEYEIRPWLLLYVTANQCEASCKERIHYMQQLHVTLGKDMQRVRRYYLHASDQAIPTDIADHFRVEFPSMGIAYSNAAALEQNMKAAGVELTLTSESYIVLVDPVGNVMMYYTDENTPQDIMTDLETLLKYSSLG